MRTTHTDQHRPAIGHRSLRRLLALRQARPADGFTLLELMIVLVIASILLSAAMPDLTLALEARQLRAASSDLLAAINSTRAQALARGRIVSLVPDGEWEQGWLVFIDSNANRRVDPGEPVLMRHGALPERLRIHAKFSDATVPFQISYNAAGRSCRAGHPKAANFGTISLGIGAQQRNIKINMQGRARLCDPASEPSTCTGPAG